VCGRRNETKYLKDFFFSTRADDIQLKNVLMSTIKDRSDFFNANNDRVKLGIPCCGCYHVYFGTRETVHLGSTDTVAAWILKLVVAGAEGSGNSEILRRFSTSTFSIDHKLTIGASFSVKDVPIDNRLSVKLQIWDFATEERFRWLLPEYCRGASGALVYFDVNDYETFAQVPEWIDVIRKEAKDIPVMLVGTRCDLPSPQVSREVANEYAMDSGCVGVMFCSCENSTGVEETFSSMAQWMVQYFNSIAGN
jgi:small GTP-binding protein